MKRLIAQLRRPDAPIALRIVCLLVGSLVVAQLATLALTLLLPPKPPEQHSLADIAAGLKGATIDTAANRPLMRTIENEPPSLNSAGWVASERSSADLARLLNADPDDVRLLFYAPPPFAGAGGGALRQRAEAAPSPITLLFTPRPSRWPAPAACPGRCPACARRAPLAFQAEPSPARRRPAPPGVRDGSHSRASPAPTIAQAAGSATRARPCVPAKPHPGRSAQARWAPVRWARASRDRAALAVPASAVRAAPRSPARLASCRASRNASRTTRCSRLRSAPRPSWPSPNRPSR
jgi:two-component system, OmpR family, sensor kinase